MNLTLNLRTRIELFEGSDEWEEAIFPRVFPARATALLICDMWDDHWCKTAARRADALAHKMNAIIVAARDRGVQIIHAPSECMDFYRDTPQRRRMTRLPAVKGVPARRRDTPLLRRMARLPAVKRVLAPHVGSPPFPIDDSDGGCEDSPQCPTFRAWTRQHPAISIEEPDVISDSGPEVYCLLRHRDIQTLAFVGVHANFCVVWRSFGIRQMSRWGVQCVLVRDLTDSAYNPAKPPFVSHEEGTELVIRHIEQYWCPTIASDDLARPEQVYSAPGERSIRLRRHGA